MSAVDGLEVRGLSYGHGGRSLFDSLTFRCPAGRVCAVLGSNGTGKTTLLETLMGMIPAIAGEVHTENRPGFVAQHVGVDTALPVLDVVTLGRAGRIGLFSRPGAHDVAVCRAWLEALGIGGLAARDYRSLSGGQRQLVMIARALVSECRVLLLDEPMSALDLRRQKEVLALVRRLASERSMTVLFSTHEPQHAWAAGGDVLLLGPGRRWRFGSARTVMTDDVLTELYSTPVKSVGGDGSTYFVADFG